MKSIKNIRKEMKLSGLMLIVCLVGVVGCGSEPLEKEVGHSMLNETSGREQDKTCSDMETMMSFDNEIEEKTPVAAITETTDSTTEGEVDTEAVDKNEPAAVIATENLGNTQEETEQAYVQTGSIEAHLRREHYAGEVLVATDFDVRVTMPDGRVLRNPRGWTATPLELSQGENIITIAYDMLRVQISVNADNRTENTNTGQQDVVVQEDTIVPPAVLSSNQIFSLQGASVLMETVDMGQEYLDKIIFLGDSRTYSFKAYGVLSGGKDTTQVWVPRSGTMSLSAQSYERIVYPETGIEITIREAVVMKLVCCRGGCLMKREELIDCFQDTLQMSEKGKIKKATMASVKSNRVYRENFVSKRNSEHEWGEIVVCEGTTLNMAKMYGMMDKVAVLNFANPVNPGGGVTVGAMAQEECLCRSSNLYKCISHQNVYGEYYAYHQRRGDHLYSDRLIYTENVVVFKNDDPVPSLLPKKQWFQVDVITCAAPYLQKGVYVEALSLLYLFKSRIKNIFEAAREHKVKVIVLGAFGCGAFHNPPEIVAEAFRQVIQEENYLNSFKTIVFAIKPTGDHCPNLEAFRQRFFG